MSRETVKTGMMEKAYRYTRALSRWIKAGRPVRAEVDIQMIFERYCKECPEYNRSSRSCGRCGCRVHTGTNPLTNKIAMGTESCPEKKW